MKTDPIELRRSDRPVSFYLSPDEALVLFEFLSRGEDGVAGCYRTVDPSEQTVMWALHGILEEWLTAPFDPAYEALVESARAAVREARQG